MSTSSSPGRETADPRRWRILAVLALVQFMLVLDDTVVSVALPSIQRDLGFSRTSLAWVVNGYVLAFGGLLLLGGRLADRVGRRRMYLIGLTLFTVASLTSGLAQNEAMLVVSRFGQGAGAALVSPAALSIVALLFTDPAERTRALGLWGGLAALGGTLGVVLSGALNDLASWRWIFLINLPFAAVALALVPRMVAESRTGRAGRPDVLGALTVTGGIGAIVYGLLASADAGFGAAKVSGALAGGVGLLVAFIAVERRAADPLVRFGFLRNRTRGTSNILVLLSSAAFYAYFFCLTLYMQDVLHYSPLQTGLAYVPVGVGVGVGVGIGLGIGAATQISQRAGIRVSATAGFLIAAVGQLWLAALPVHGSYLTNLLPAMLVVAVGSGFQFPSMTIGAVHAVSDRDAGLASGLQSAGQQIGGALGLSILVSIAAHHTRQLIAGGVATGSAATSGYTLAFAIAGLLLLAGAAVAATGLANVRGATPPLPGGARAEPIAVGGD